MVFKIRSRPEKITLLVITAIDLINPIFRIHKKRLCLALFIIFFLFNPDHYSFGNELKDPALKEGRQITAQNGSVKSEVKSDEEESVKENLSQPIIVNGDTVEYFTENNEVVASGSVEVIYKGTKLTCDKLTVNTKTKEGKAEGNAKLQDDKGIVEGQKIIYNFDTKTGVIIDAKFRSNPYFGRADNVIKASQNEFIANNGYATTCSFDKPHYRISSKRINLFPEDKIQTQSDTFYIDGLPVLYLPRYNKSLKDPMMHVRVMPGKSKDWGAYLLTAWRYNITDHINGRIYLDYRNKLGIAEGFGANYDTVKYGRGDFKFYYTNEKPDDLPSGISESYQRYLVRLRHKWTIDQQTNFVSELYKIEDERRKHLDDHQRNFLKDYFYREYEKDSQPLSYALFHHSFSNSSLDVLVQKRLNPWFDQLEKLPEVKYSLPSLQIGDTRFYYENNSSIGYFDKKAETSPVTTNDQTVMRLDTTNKFSLPMKVSFIEFTPFISDRQTIYDKGVNGSDLPVRTIFSSGADVSSKFYRIFDISSNLLGLDINKLRHVITPTVSYVYEHEPTILADKLKQIDTIDSLAQSNSVKLELSNKLQTKRKGANVDLLDFRITTNYNFKPKATSERGSNLSDIFFDLTVLPYSYLRFDLDATYDRTGRYSDPNYNHFSNVNYDINFDFGKDRSLGIGQRYLRKESNEITWAFNWRFNPKWKFSMYQRYNIGSDAKYEHGLKEQEYTVSRDLHCWEMDVSLNTKKGDGSTIWFVFRLKAFPESEFAFEQGYNKPKSGSQNNP